MCEVQLSEWDAARIPADHGPLRDLIAEDEIRGPHGAATPRERQIIRLRHYEEWQFKDIARVTGAAKSTTEGRDRRAMEKMGRIPRPGRTPGFRGKEMRA